MSTEIILSSGEPGGIGPDLCLHYCMQYTPTSDTAPQVLYLGDPLVFQERAQLLGYGTFRYVIIEDPDQASHVNLSSGTMPILPFHFPQPSVCGYYAVENSATVLQMLNTALSLVRARPTQRALVTAPIQKSAFYEAQLDFTDHTSWLEKSFPGTESLMLLQSDILRVALLTTHLPLQAVASQVTSETLYSKLHLLSRELKKNFGYHRPHITVTALNPHAGDHGLLGREEIDILIPTINRLREEGLLLSGPLPADSLFTAIGHTDAFFCLYHDQGLPVFKALSRYSGVNITLGLPIVRTSVDHGTALARAGTGDISTASLATAINTAAAMLKTRHHYQDSMT